MNENEFVLETKKLGINITNEMLDKLNIYYEMLIETNKYLNLTRITDKKDVYLKHFYDSLTITRDIDLTKNLLLCDVGTGAGFPGIVLKIVFPNLKITLIDSLNKRINFLNDVIEKLELEDIETVHSRIEDYAKDNREKFDIVTSRAVANLKLLSEISIPLVKINGYFIPLKGNVDEEIDDSKDILNKLDCIIEKKDSFNLIKENSCRNILLIKKNNITNKKYPRRIDIIKKELENNKLK